MILTLSSNISAQSLCVLFRKEGALLTEWDITPRQQDRSGPLLKPGASNYHCLQLVSTQIGFPLGFTLSIRKDPVGPFRFGT